MLRPPRSPRGDVVATALRCLVFLGLAGLAAAAAPAEEARRIPDDLAPEYRIWLEEVDLLITPEERQVFLELEKDYQRDGFIARFWQSRDPVTRTERNELQEEWSAKVQSARERFGRLDDARSRILLLSGEPVTVLSQPCPRLFRAVEMWAYGQLPEPLVLVFVQPAKAEPHQLWDPARRVFDLLREPDYVLWERCSTRPGLGDAETRLSHFQEAEYRCLLEQLAGRCPEEHQAVAAFLSRIAPMEANEFNLVRRRVERRPAARDDEWLATFSAHSTDLPPGAAPLPATLEVLFPGRRGARTVVQGVLVVPAGEAAAVELAGRASSDFQLTGEVLRRGELFESFRYRFDLPAGEGPAGEGPAGEEPADELPLVFQRLLRPGSYRLILKLEDLHSQRCFRHEADLEVPRVDRPQAVPSDPQTAPWLGEAARALAADGTSLRLVPPRGEVHAGMVRFDALAPGGGFAKVIFYLNGARVLARRRPPYSVELDLGRVPRVHAIRVVGFDADEREIARDEIEINTGRNHFAVRLVEPQAARTYGLSLLARAEVDVPEGQRLDRVELYLGEHKLATIYQPPFEQTLLLDGSRQLTYVRAKAYLDDGNAAEDVVFVNAPDYLDELDVQLVELYAAVADGQGRLAEGLEAADFTVIEDGEEQQIRRFAEVRDLPIHAGILLDVSSSMEERLPAVRQAALRFFAEALTPKDRAAVVAFNDQPRLTAGFTNEVEPLAREMASLKAEGGTALWDSVVFTLQYFNGVTGQRAILLLTDGEDQASRFTFEEVLSYAQSAGVALYVIGLDLEKLTAARPRLSRLAAATGGRSHFIPGVAGLGEIYAQIQRELRSKYLIVYQSSATGGDGFRRVELRLSRPELEAKTIQGYYP